MLDGLDGVPIGRHGSVMCEEDVPSVSGSLVYQEEGVRNAKADDRVGEELCIRGGYADLGRVRYGGLVTLCCHSG